MAKVPVSKNRGRVASAEVERKSAGYGVPFDAAPEVVANMPVSGRIVRNGAMEAEMARDGLRYGDPSLPRYATGRVDGRAPAFPGTGRGQLTVGKQRG